MNDLNEWLEEVSGDEYIWYVKRLSGNDTLANKTHQAGPYIPKSFIFTIFPVLHDSNRTNPDTTFNLRIDSHKNLEKSIISREIRAIWYNNKYRGGTRDESRITNFGGYRSPLLNPENTGALTVFAFQVDGNAEALGCCVWVCKNELEEQIIEERIGSIDPSEWYVHVNKEDFRSKFLGLKYRKPSCWLTMSQIPPEWLEKFPTGAEIIKKTVELRRLESVDPDKRLLLRRECEYDIFKSIEEARELPIIQKGFDSVDSFIKKALSILNSRKTRTGRSLELHIKEIFQDEGLVEEKHFSYSPESEDGKKPDFLFPTEKDYKNKIFPADKLNMLAVKTTCKDRWRQILNEADRIQKKHLLTLQEGVSENQFREMRNAGVQLVVPKPLLKKYPQSIHKELLTFSNFIKKLN